MKSCELCKLAARMYCESDQASLCWGCDAKVHSANFLVARHSRSLLCHVCQSPTAWNASGSKLGPTVSVCESCISGGEGMKESRGGEEEGKGVNDGETDTEDEYDGDDDDDEEEDQIDDDDEEAASADDDDDGDNQVVPWSLTTPPPASCSSSSEESSSRFCNSKGAILLKRLRSDASDLRSDDDYSCSSSHRNHSLPAAAMTTRDNESDFADLLRPSKRPTTEANRSATVQRGPVSSRTGAILESLKRYHEHDSISGNNASAAIFGICNLSKDPEAVD